MSGSRRNNFIVMLVLLAIIATFAYSYNSSVKAAIANAASDDREILQNYNSELINRFSKTQGTDIWDDIVEEYDDIVITVEDSEGKTIAQTQNAGQLTSFDIRVQTPFEYNGNAYLIMSSIFILRGYINDAAVILKFVLTEFLIFIAALFLLIFVLYTIILRPYREFYESIEEFEMTGKLRKNKFKGYIGKVYDKFFEITQNLERQQNSQRQIIASISHDIKTPLTSIMGYTEMLKKSNLSEERKERYLSTVYQKSLEIRGFVDEIDEYLSYNMEKSVISEAVSTKEICKMLQSEYADELESNGIHFEIINRAEKTTVYLDMQKMKRVFGNIIGNSVKHFDKEEKIIRIEFCEKNEKLIIKISDNGEGVEEEKMKLIFEPLYTSDKGRKVAGLGLAICKEIVESHSGTIRAKKASLGGLEICVELPT